jgi:hypothetical protein
VLVLGAWDGEGASRGDDISRAKALSGRGGKERRLKIALTATPLQQFTKMRGKSTCVRAARQLSQGCPWCPLRAPRYFAIARDYASYPGATADRDHYATQAD